MTNYSIGDLSRQTGVKVTTIRFYESRGLLDPPDRSEGGQRRYDRASLERLAFIRHGRDLGLSLEAIGTLAELNDDPALSNEKAHMIASDHLADIRHRIKRLKSLEKELSRILDSCDADTIGDCQLIQSLVSHTWCAGNHS